jgi:hypothetical protein
VRTRPHLPHRQGSPHSLSLSPRLAASRAQVLTCLRVCGVAVGVLQVHFILDEIVMGGMVLETSLKEIIKAVNGTVKYIRASKDTAAVAKPVGKNVKKG